MGRAYAGDDDGIHQPEKWDYRVVARCRGFEPPEASQPTPRQRMLPPGYCPPDPAQTVRDWIAQQLDPDQEEERAFYLRQVLPAFGQATRGAVHAPVETSPDGQLTEEFAMVLGARLLYNPPPAPDDPAQDHRQIMEWLRALRDLVPVIEQTWREASLSRTSVETAP